MWSLEYILRAYRAHHTDSPSSLFPPGTKAAVSLLGLVGHQNLPEENKMIDYLYVKANPKS